jgi:hypothetical protein
MRILFVRTIFSSFFLLYIFVSKLRDERGMCVEPYFVASYHVALPLQKPLIESMLVAEELLRHFFPAETAVEVGMTAMMQAEWQCSSPSTKEQMEGLLGLMSCIVDYVEQRPNDSHAAFLPTFKEQHTLLYRQWYLSWKNPIMPEDFSHWDKSVFSGRDRRALREAMMAEVYKQHKAYMEQKTEAVVFVLPEFIKNDTRKVMAFLLALKSLAIQEGSDQKGQNLSGKEVVLSGGVDFSETERIFFERLATESHFFSDNYQAQYQQTLTEKT